MPKYEDSIDPQVKKTLDSLLGDDGLVDELPVYSSTKAGVPFPTSSDEMTAPIMKGSIIGEQNKCKPFIAIRLRCLNTPEELAQKMADQYGRLDHSKPIEKVLVLLQYRSGGPGMWNQLGGSSSEIFPCFFPWNFTDPEDRGVTDSQSENFQKLQKVIKEGSGEDINGVRWGIIQGKS